MRALSRLFVLSALPCRRKSTSRVRPHRKRSIPRSPFDVLKHQGSVIFGSHELDPIPAVTCTEEPGRVPGQPCDVVGQYVFLSKEHCRSQKRVRNSAILERKLDARLPPVITEWRVGGRIGDARMDDPPNTGNLCKQRTGLLSFPLRARTSFRPVDTVCNKCCKAFERHP